MHRGTILAKGMLFAKKVGNGTIFKKQYPYRCRGTIFRVRGTVFKPSVDGVPNSTPRGTKLWTAK